MLVAMLGGVRIDRHAADRIDARVSFAASVPVIVRVMSRATCVIVFCLKPIPRRGI